jgi:hypothetical protein
MMVVKLVADIGVVGADIITDMAMMTCRKVAK